MTIDKDITIDGADINCSIDFSYYKEHGEVTIVIHSIEAGKINVIDLISDDYIESLKVKLKDYYENYKFNEIEELMNKTWYGIDNSQKEV